MFEKQEAIVIRENSYFWQDFVCLLGRGVQQITWAGDRAEIWFEPNAPFNDRLTVINIIENWHTAPDPTFVVTETITAQFSFDAGFAGVWDMSEATPVGSGEFTGGEIQFPYAAGTYLVAALSTNGELEVGVIDLE